MIITLASRENLLSMAATPLDRSSTVLAPEPLVTNDGAIGITLGSLQYH